MSEWISVIEKLPIDGELVLVLCEIYNPTRGPLYQERCDWIFQGRFFRRRGWEVFFNNDAIFVKHWMPLPKPVEET